MQRWIIHVDMDAFFAAVEQRDNPQLRGCPVIIGGTGTRGVVSTASYEARKYGVHSAMSTLEARRRCPQGIFLATDHAKYSKVSSELLRIFSEYSPLVEPLSLDEAFLDVTGMEGLFTSPVDIAVTIKKRIQTELALTASAGVAPNKFLAKLASDMNKPDGLMVIRPDEIDRILADIPVSRLWGVGKNTTEILLKIGLKTIGQVAAADPSLLVKYCGQFGHTLHQLANGQDDRQVESDCQPKSIGKETTFSTDLFGIEELKTELWAQVEKVGWRLRRQGLSGRTVTVKVRFASFRTTTRSHTLGVAVNLDESIYHVAEELLGRVSLNEGVRLLGVAVSGLVTSGSQLSLFEQEDKKAEAVAKAVDKLKERFGEGTVMRGPTMIARKR
ncbi:DNA polymerase IV [Sporomusa acidovorans]|uniref:DNA polymerase IV n=1 Tax=Sporomusa acidovorans (strain ATCC 49682 / DSM 3132 / Mol) TaxID=1123286 RepID=A0ABZ3JBG9_SPOA4|nr:DNA polymerase IV [Sporomusa acidovorans]OZC13305.1 DNA polymerase IV [Sporomusa acidovorans DSM 3132]SDD97373.1 DNA polymerase-4 [Sporomusa acidovorans]